MWDTLTPKTDRKAFAPLNAITFYYGAKVKTIFKSLFF